MSTFDKMYFEETVPFAGQVTNLAIAAVTPATLDLRTAGNTSLTMANADQFPVTDAAAAAAVPTTTGGCVGRFVTFFADGADAGLIFGPTLASVSSANAPVLATTGTSAAGCCIRLPSGTRTRIFVHATGQFLGYTGGGSGFLRIWPSSRPM